MRPAATILVWAALAVPMCHLRPPRKRVGRWSGQPGPAHAHSCRSQRFNAWQSSATCGPLHMPPEDPFEFLGRVQADQSVPTLSIPIEQKKRHMAYAMRAGEGPSLTRTNVCYEILDLVRIECVYRNPGLALKRPACRASGIVDLHHRGDPVTQPGEVVFPVGRSHLLGQIPSGAPDHGERYQSIADLEQHRPASQPRGARQSEYRARRGTSRLCRSSLRFLPFSFHLARTP